MANVDEGDGLVARAKRGDDAAREQLLRRHLPGLEAFVRLRRGAAVAAYESCADLVQSTCREILADLPDLRSDDEAVFRRWLFDAALHKIIDRARFLTADRRDIARNASPGPDLDAAVLQEYATFLTPSRTAMAREEAARIEAAFAKLPEDYREVLAMVRIAGHTHREIAARLGKSEEAVRKTLQRAAARLAMLLA